MSIDVDLAKAIGLTLRGHDEPRPDRARHMAREIDGYRTCPPSRAAIF